eukprot:3474632-Amphidinium_carterae.1
MLPGQYSSCVLRGGGSWSKSACWGEVGFLFCYGSAELLRGLMQRRQKRVEALAMIDSQVCTCSSCGTCKCVAR